MPTIAAGDTTTVSGNLAEYRDALKALSEARGSWTPSYSGGITAIGNATVVARYHQIGKLVMGHALITMGSMTSFAAATIQISMPVAPRDGGAVIGSCFAQDTGSTVRVVGVVLPSSGNFTFIGSTSNSFWANTVPFTWASTDLLRWDFCYEAA